MFSVVIPLYNKENEVKRTLESVLNQTFKDFEVVIVNDGSKDKSVEVVESFKDSRIRIITQENAGVSAARNRGIQEAKNEWIAFLDADDYWNKDKLKRLSEVIKLNEFNWLAHSFKIVNRKNGRDVIFKEEGILNDAVDGLLNGLEVHTSAIIVKKSVFLEDETLLFPKGINNSEDREVWYKLMLKFPNMYYLREFLSFYNKEEVVHSLSRNSHRGVHFLELKDRIKLNLDQAPYERRFKMVKFIDRFNRRALWRYWADSQLLQEHRKYISKEDKQLQKALSILPKKLKHYVSKTINYRK